MFSIGFDVVVVDYLFLVLLFFLFCLLLELIGVS